MYLLCWTLVLGTLTIHTICFGGFCWPGGSQLAGSCSLESFEADEGDRVKPSLTLPSPFIFHLGGLFEKKYWSTFAY